MAADSTRCAGVSLSKQKPAPSMADPHQPAIAIDEARRTRRARRFLPIRQHGRRKRILREGMQHVGQQQLLMLLLVLQAELDNPAASLRHALAAAAASRHRHARGNAPTRSAEGRVSSPRLGRGCRGPTAS